MVRPCTLPEDALLRLHQRAGAYVDCYSTEVDAAVGHAQFVEAFYTTPLFKLERLILRWFARRPSTDADAFALAASRSESFAAWQVERRVHDQVLLADFSGRTRSWLMVEPASAARTRLYFGSAVLPVRDRRSGEPRLGPAFSALLGFHRLYSRALLASARSRLQRTLC
jgi:hypothetical protein